MVFTQQEWRYIPIKLKFRTEHTTGLLLNTPLSFPPLPYPPLHFPVTSYSSSTSPFIPLTPLSSLPIFSQSLSFLLPLHCLSSPSLPCLLFLLLLSPSCNFPFLLHFISFLFLPIFVSPSFTSLPLFLFGEGRDRYGHAADFTIFALAIFMFSSCIVTDKWIVYWESIYSVWYRTKVLTDIVVLFDWFAGSNRKTVTCYFIWRRGSLSKTMHTSTGSRCCELIYYVLAIYYLLMLLSFLLWWYVDIVMKWRWSEWHQCLASSPLSECAICCQQGTWAIGLCSSKILQVFNVLPCQLTQLGLRISHKMVVVVAAAAAAAVAVVFFTLFIAWCLLFDVSIAVKCSCVCSNFEWWGICITAIISSQSVLFFTRNWHCMVSAIYYISQTLLQPFTEWIYMVCPVTINTFSCNKALIHRHLLPPLAIKLVSCSQPLNEVSHG